MACAESPMQRSPVRDHWRKRSTATESSLTSFQSFNSPRRSRRNGATLAISSLKTREPFLANGVEPAFRDYVGALPVFVAVERHEDLPCPETAERLIRITRLRARRASTAHQWARRGRALRSRPFRERSNGGRLRRWSDRRALPLRRFVIWRGHLTTRPFSMSKSVTSVSMRR